MQVLESIYFESILKTIKSNKVMPLYAILREAKPYIYHDCDHRKILYFVFDDNFKFGVNKISEISMHEQLINFVSEEIVDIDDVQAILEGNVKGILGYNEITREELSNSSNRIILDVINKNNRLRDELKKVISNKSKILNEELDELKYKYYDITKSNDLNEIEAHRLRIVEKENDIEEYIKAFEEL